MAASLSYVIVGNGIAGTTAAELLRAEDFAAAITVIADDPFPVYYRPALKDYLAGRVREDKLWARPNSFYQQQNIRFLPERVAGIQAGRHLIQLQSGQELGYSRLLLAHGARASRLTCPGLDLDGVTTLRSVADYQSLLQRLNSARRVVVSGSGTLALETIETLRHRGLQVIHLLRRRSLWSDVLDATASDLVLQQERRDGVDLRLEEEIAEITGKQGQVSGVITTGGARIPCEMVIMAIGIEPNIDFVRRSGIPCGRGIKVDGAMRTGAPDIYAAGDVLETTDALSGRTRVIGQWYPAVQQARAAAYSMLDLLDADHPYRSAAFYNATFLYGLDFASIGLTQIPKGGSGYQEIVADPQPRTYRKAILKNGVAVGMLALGDRKGALAFKRAIDHRVNLQPVADKLFAPVFSLRDWLDRQGVPPSALGVQRQGDAAIRQAAYTGAELPTISRVVADLSRPSAPVIAILVPVQTETAIMEPDMQSSYAPVLAETRLSQTKVVTIGRQAGAYLLIDDAAISRRHAEISFANGQYILRDLGSANGTFINGKRLDAGGAYPLKPNDLVQFGKMARFTFQLRSAPASTSMRAAEPTKFHEMKTAFYDPIGADLSRPMQPQGQPIINAAGELLLPGATQAISAANVARVMESPALIVVARGIPALYFLHKGKSVVLGRDKKADIVLADVLASRRHAEVIDGPAGFSIRDLGSANGVIVNQARIDNPYLLAPGDRVTIGNALIYFMSPT
jgi:NADPH-dependent 2,4-dienoyl-CoA reductase/sulfur reductase-like enzyme/pSer/pThr/pTyr-binding forkhead associated (FHA) protein